MCTCVAGIETTEHFLLHSHSFYSQRSELFDSIQNIYFLFLSLNVNCKVTFLSYGSANNTNNFSNKDIIWEVIDLLKRQTTSTEHLYFDHYLLLNSDLWFLLMFNYNFLTLINVYCAAFTLNARLLWMLSTGA